MKKLFILMLCTTIFVVTANSQENQTKSKNKITEKLGIKGGINLTNLYVDNVKDENVKIGLNVGLYTQIPVSKYLSIQPELLYTGKGAQLNYNNIFGTGKYMFNLNYIEVPVAAVINVAKNFNIHAGPYIAMLVSANVKDVDNNGNISGAKSLNKDNFETFDYGVFGGLGVDVGSATIGARYTYGLKEIGKSGLSGNLTQNSKNSALSFYIGFSL